MGHPDLQNTTPFAFEALFVTNEESRPVLTPILKATYAIPAHGALELAEEQRPVDFEGKHFGEPGESSLIAEPETAFTKVASDVVLVGQAYAPTADTTEMEIRFQVGDLTKRVRVSGDRVWEPGLMGARATDPEPFDTMPLVWERAFGGWDTTSEKEKRHDWEPRNPIGVGFRARRAKLEEGAPLPNIEYPDALLTRYTGSSRPAGFGFICPNWSPRRELAGTYDAAWEAERAPRLPTDFDRAYFNAAPPDQIVEGYLTGREAVAIEGVRPDGALRFQLPGLEAPRAAVRLRGAPDIELKLNLDTLVIDAEAMEVVLLWRATAALRAGPLDVAAITVRCANAPQRREAEAPPTNVVPLFESQPGAEAARTAPGGL